VTSSRIVRALFIGSLLIPLGLAFVMSDRGRGYVPLYTFLVLYAVAGFCLIPVLARRGNGDKVFLSLAVLNVLLLTPEMILHYVRFESALGVQFGYPRPTSREPLLPDSKLFWKLPPNQDGVNALGFRGPDWVVPKPPDVYRLMFLGDSVQRAYPDVVEVLLNADRPRRERVETLNLSVEGYSSYQGRILTDRFGAMLEPDLVVVCYGWNDHWQAYGDADSSKEVDTDSSLTGRVSQFAFRHSRTLQWLRSLRGASVPLPIPRVSVAAYRDNLTYIGAFFTERKVPVVFITSPTAHDVVGVPDYLVEMDFAKDKASVIRLHHAYNDVVREVASREPMRLLDLAADTLTPDTARAVFANDGIHLTPRGIAFVARRVTDFVEAYWELPSAGERCCPAGPKVSVAPLGYQTDARRRIVWRAQTVWGHPASRRSSGPTHGMNLWSPRRPNSVRTACSVSIDTASRRM
jgi:lysophospholipase L1-like esterase